MSVHYADCCPRPAVAKGTSSRPHGQANRRLVVLNVDVEGADRCAIHVVPELHAVVTGGGESADEARRGTLVTQTCFEVQIVPCSYEINLGGKYIS